MATSQMYGLFGETYYNVKESNNIVIPNNTDYKKSGIQVTVHDSLNQAEIDAYFYHSDLVTESNDERIDFMKDLFTTEKVDKIDDLNEDYVVSLEYEIYNKDGNMITNGNTAVKAKYCNAVINSNVSESNTLMYRKAFVFDGRIELQIPSISRYGIKNSYAQNPFVIKFKKVGVYSTIGPNMHVSDSNVQVNNYGSHASYENYKPLDMNSNIISSKFMTNAKVGTTIIDQLVVPAVLEIPEEYTEVTMCEISCNDKSYIMSIDHKLDLIIVNVEVVIDNFSIAYDKEDINKLLDENKVVSKPDDDDTTE